MKTNLMVLIAGDNNLDKEGNIDITEMMSVQNTGDELTILVQYDQSKEADDSGAKRFLIRDGKKELIENLGEINTGDAKAVTEFIRWGIENFEAERNIVVLWNHGGGTKDNEGEKYANAAKGVTKAEENPTLGNQPSFFSSEARMKQIDELMKSYKSEQGEATRSLTKAESKSILLDDEAKDFIDNLELKKAFQDVGQKIDIIGFDACLMNMMEVVYQLKDYAKVVVGSEELEPGNGWDYNAFVSYLVNNPDASNEAVAEAIVNSYIVSYKNSPSLKLTLSALSTEKLTKVASCMNDFAYSILCKESNLRKAFMYIIDTTQVFNYNAKEKDYRDLRDFVLLTQEEYGDDDEIYASSTVLLEALDELVISNQTKNHDNAHGLSVYLPLAPDMSKFAETIFYALDINSEAPYWLKLFKQIGNIDNEPNPYVEKDEVEKLVEVDLLDDEDEYN